MKLKRAGRTIACVLLIVALAAGCAAGADREEPAVPDDFFSDERPPGSQDAPAVPALDPDDPELRQALWEDVLYWSITSFGNLDGFDDPSEVPAETVAQFAFLRTLYREGESSLTAEGEGSRLFIGIDRVDRVARDLLGVEDLDHREEVRSFHAARGAYGYSMRADQTIPDWDESTAWGIRFEDLVRTEGGKLQASLVSRVGEDDALIQTRWIYTFEERADGTLRLLAMEKIHPDNDLVRIKGAQRVVDAIEGFDGTPQDHALRMVGVLPDGTLLMRAVSRGPGPADRLLRLDVESMRLLGDMTLSGRDRARVTSDGFLVLAPDAATHYDASFQPGARLVVPQRIQDLQGRDTKRDDDGYPLTWFGGYDATEDGRAFVYADERGLWLLEAQAEEPVLLDETEVFPDDELLPRSMFFGPRFILEEDAVLARMSGYESVHDVRLIRLEAQNAVQSLGLDDYNTLFSADGAYAMSLEGDAIRLLDLANDRARTLDVTALRGDAEGEGSVWSASARYGAFSTRRGGKDGETVWIHRLDFETGELAVGLVRVERAMVNIIGVDRTGRILFSYRRYPNEYGFGLSKPAG